LFLSGKRRVTTMNKINKLTIIIALVFVFLNIKTAGFCVSGDISNTTWYLDSSPYVVTDSVHLLTGTTLFIQPGVVVRFTDNKSITISGVLDARGNESDPIVFTSDDDPGYGGSGTGAAGQWDKIYFDGAGVKGSIMKNCIVKYGGYGGEGQIYIYKETFDDSGNPEVQIINSSITNSSSAGIQLRITSATVLNCTITNNVTGVYAVTMFQGLLGSNTISNNSGWGIRADSSLCVISNNTISNNYEGIHLEGSAFSPNIIANTINSNTSYGISSSLSSANINENIVTNHINSYPFYQYNDSFPKYFNNTVTGNKYTGISVWCDADPFIGIGSGKWVNAHIPYVIVSDGFKVKAGATFEIQSGTVIKFTKNTQAFEIDGVLNAQGTPDEKISFTSVQDDASDGIDTNSNGPSTGSHGEWRSVVFSGNMVDGSIMKNCIVKYGGYSTNPQIQIENTIVAGKTGEVTLENCNINNSYGSGIYLQNSKAHITNCTIENNCNWGGGGIAGISCVTFDGTIDSNTITNNGNDGGIRLWNSNCTISSNVISGNSSGINIVGYGTSLIENNKINSNSTGIYFAASASVIRKNEIKNNNTGLLAYYYASTPYGQTIINNDISNNTVYGFNNTITPDPPLIIAENNWWGDVLGPKHINNPNYNATMGNKVSDYVDYSPWIGLPTQINNLIATANHQNQTIVLSWASPGNRYFELTNYIIRYTTFPLTEQIWNTCAYELQNPPIPDVPGSQQTYTVSNLAFDHTYYFAIKSKDSQNNYSQISNVTFADLVPPQLTITNPAPNAVINRPINITANIIEDVSIDRVIFYVDNISVSTKPAGPYTYFWNTTQYNDGTHKVKLEVYDSSQNKDSKEINVTVNTLSPNTPSITAPADNFNTSINSTTVSGQAEQGVTVAIYVNGYYQKSAITTSPVFSITNIPLLIEGINTVYAKASDPKGTSGASNSIKVILDTGPPPKVNTLMAISKPAGEIGLSWQKPDTETPAYYKLYRADSFITATTAPIATELIQSNIQLTSYSDTPPSDGIWYYAITSVDNMGNESVVSNCIETVSDRQLPKADIILSAVPPISVGIYSSTVVVTEVLSIVPSLLYTPENGSPILVSLKASSPLTYYGTIIITTATPSGTARFSFTGKDLADNTGTEITSGQAFDIDTIGPKAAINLSKPAPVSAGTVQITLTTTQNAQSAPALKLVPYGKNPITESIPISLTGSYTNWQGELVITSLTGDGLAKFIYQATDILGNIGTEITSGSTFYIDTILPNAPTLAAPLSKKGGEIVISWAPPLGGQSYDLPYTYNIYRRLQTEPSLSITASGVTTLSYSDIPTDGNYYYAVKAVDKAGNEGASSSEILAASDSLSPNPPANLSSVLQNGWITLSWNQPSSGETPATYNLYRSINPITAIEGLTPLKVNIPSVSTVDLPQEDAIYHYVVTSLDIVKNESIISNETTYTFDSAPPKISITGVTNNGYYKNDVTPVITATDLNFDTFSVRLNGVTYESGTPIISESTYTLFVEAKDTANHISSTTISFIIDKTLPVITITGAADSGYYETPVKPQAQATDTYFKDINAALNNYPFPLGETIEQDGIFILKVTATDLAGNIAEKIITFTLDVAPSPPININVTISQGSGASFVWAPNLEPDTTGYNLYRDGTKVNPVLIRQNSYLDPAYTSNLTHIYQLSAVDAKLHESKKSTVTVIPAELNLTEYGTQENGISYLTAQFLDTIKMSVRNKDTQARAFGALTLNLFGANNTLIDNRSYEITSIPSNSTKNVEQPIITKETLPATAKLTASLDLPTDTNAVVKLYAEYTLNVRNPPGAVLDIFEPLVRGADGWARVKITNYGSTPMQILTASGGDNPNTNWVDDLTIYLKDQVDGTIYSQGHIFQRKDGLVTDWTTPDYSYAEINKGNSFIFAPVKFFVPTYTPDNVTLEAVIKRTYFNYPNLPMIAGKITAPGYSTSIKTSIVAPDYSVDVRTNKTIYEPGEPIIIYGTATYNGTGELVSTSPVKIGISVRGFDRNYTVTTDTSGYYCLQFNPLSGETGHYTVWAVHPIVLAREIDTEFYVVDLKTNLLTANVDMSKNSSYTFPITISNPCENTISIKEITADPSTLTGINIALGSQAVKKQITPNETTNLNVQIDASTSAPDSAQFSITIVSTATVQSTIRTLTKIVQVNLNLHTALPITKVDPMAIDVSLKAGEIKTKPITISNVGYAPIENVILSSQQTYPWITLAVNPDLGNVGPNITRTFDISICPPANTPTGIYQDKIFIHYGNLQGATTLYITARITTSLVGGALFTINSDINARVPEANIRLQSQEIASLTFSAQSDANGIASITNIPVGRYTYSADKPGYLPASASILIEPDVTATIQPVLQSSPMEVKWTVTPTVIKDEYDISLNITYKTNVPAPVLIPDNMFFNAKMDPGSIMYGQFTIKNEGLITATSVQFQYQPSDHAINVEYLVQNNLELAAGASMVVPFRITLSKYHSPRPVDPCEKFDTTAICNYGFMCAAGTWVQQKFQQAFNIIAAGGSCGDSAASVSYVPSTVSATPGGYTYSFSGGQGTPSSPGTSVTATPSNITPVDPPVTSCGGTPATEPDIYGEESSEPSCPMGGGHSVNVTNGNVYETFTDFSKNSPYGPVEFSRTYNSNDSNTANTGYGWANPASINLTDVNGVIKIRDKNGSQATYAKRGTKVTDTQFSGGVPTPPWKKPGDESNITKNPDGSYTWRNKNGTKTNFRPDGKLSDITDSNGNKIQYNYDTNANLTSINHPSNRIVTFTSDTQNRITETKVSYNNGPQQLVASYTYDTNNNLTSAKDYRGDPVNGVVTGYEYDTVHRLTRITHPNGTKTKYLYDGVSGKCIERKEEDTSNNIANRIAYDYLDNKTTRRIDYNGANTNIMTIEYTIARGKSAITKITNAINKTTPLARDDEFNIKSRVDTAGNSTTYTYDGMGNVLSIADPAGNITRFTYESVFNKVTSITDPKGNKTFFTYEGKGNLTSITDSQGNSTEMTYDLKGLLKTTKDAKGKTTTYNYDSISGNLTSITDPLNRTTVMAYDDDSNVTQVEDANHKLTHYAYDGLGNLTSVTDADNKTTTYEYEAGLNFGGGGCQSCPSGSGSLLSKVIDANSKQTLFDYDGFGQLVKVTNPLSQFKSFGYDAVGNLISIIDANNNTIGFSYDAINRLVTKTLPDDTVSYTYDDAGNITAIENTDSLLTMAYDVLGRVTSVTQKFKSDGHTRTITYTYDNNGNRLSAIIGGGAWQSNYSYDSLNRLTGITNISNQSFGFEYDNLSRRTKLTYPNGTETNYTYDDVSQLTNLEHRHGATALTSFGYVYDDIGNRTSMTDPLGTHNYSYDSLYRLVAAGFTPANPLFPAETFTYDSVGNRLSSHISTNYIYNNANRLTSDDQFTYSYDNNGNQTSKTDKSTNKYYEYTYNNENQLTIYKEYTDSSKTTLLKSANYKYDGLGRRIEKEVDSIVTRFVYDNEDIILELNGSNNIQAKYTHGPGIDEPMEMARGGQDYYYHADGLGTIVTITDSQGAMKEQIKYEVFGRCTFQDSQDNVLTQSAIGNPYTFTAREYDNESGLFYYRTRDYDSNTGRFTAEDRIGFAGGINFYAYVNGNPVSFIDPFGFEAQVCASRVFVGGIPTPGFHSYIKFSDGTTYGLHPYYGDSTPFPFSMYQRAGVYKNIDTGGICKPIKPIKSEIGSCKTSIDMENRLKNIANNWQRRAFYWNYKFPGNDSNNWARMVVNQSGGEFPNLGVWVP